MSYGVHLRTFHATQAPNPMMTMPFTPTKLRNVALSFCSPDANSTTDARRQNVGHNQKDYPSEQIPQNLGSLKR